MTTSIMRTTVSPDMVITTPEQLTEAFFIWGTLYEDEQVKVAAPAMSKKLLSILESLNKK